MVYKKYRISKGKKLGPYYYKSVRDKNGKVRTIYIKKGSSEYLKIKEKEKQEEKRQPRSKFKFLRFKRHELVVLAVLIIAIIGLFLTAGYPTGFLVAESFDQNWEHHMAINATNLNETLSTHIIFDQYKPENCSDGIEVVTIINSSLVEINFSVENSTYSDNLCSETTAIFNNIIYNETLPTNETLSLAYHVYYGRIPVVEPVNITLENSTLSLDKEIYDLNETILISISTHPNTTIKLTIQNPTTLYTLIQLSEEITETSKTSTYSFTPDTSENYTVNAELTLLNETKNLIASFEVIKTEIPEEIEKLETLSQGAAEIGKPVSWTQIIIVSNPYNYSIYNYTLPLLIPKDAFNMEISEQK